jgi:hypothetical protein
MVGSVLLERMQIEGDFAHFEQVFFTTRNVGGASSRKPGPLPTSATPTS